jgi:hypothetical protein
MPQWAAVEVTDNISYPCIKGLETLESCGSLSPGLLGSLYAHVPVVWNVRRHLRH